MTSDIAVVGSGAGAATVAGELARVGLHVVLVEAGPALDGRPGQHVRSCHTAAQDDPRGFRSRLLKALVPHGGKCQAVDGLPGQRSIHSVGGMMTYWSGISIPPHPELEPVPGIPAELWAGLLARAESLLGVSAAPQAASTRTSRILARLTPRFGGLAQPLPLAQQHRNGMRGTTGADSLLAADEAANPVQILADNAVTRVLHAGGRAHGLDAYNRNGVRLRVSAGAVVVAAGTIGTPQLLLASGLRELPALGRYLTDHVMVVSSVCLDRIVDMIDRTDRPLGVCIRVSEGRPFHVNIAPGWNDVATERSGVDPQNMTDVQHLVGTEPSPDNRLTLDQSRRDGFGLPAVSVRFEYSSEDRSRIGGAIQDQYEIADMLRQPHSQIVTQVFPPGASLHLMGTCRMGEEDDGRSVVDPSGRVWGYENLHLAGNGLIASRNSTNPTLTTVALGLNCANALIGS